MHIKCTCGEIKSSWKEVGSVFDFGYLLGIHFETYRSLWEASKKSGILKK